MRVAQPGIGWPTGASSCSRSSRIAARRRIRALDASSLIRRRCRRHHVRPAIGRGSVKCSGDGDDHLDHNRPRYDSDAGARCAPASNRTERPTRADDALRGFLAPRRCEPAGVARDVCGPGIPIAAWAIDQHFKNLTVTTASLSLLVNYPHFLISHKLARTRAAAPSSPAHWWQLLAVPRAADRASSPMRTRTYDVPVSQLPIVSLLSRDLNVAWQQRARVIGAAPWRPAVRAHLQRDDLHRRAGTTPSRCSAA